MKQLIYQYAPLLLMFGALMFLSFLSLTQCEKCNKCEDIVNVCDRYTMYDDDYTFERSYINGVYFHPTHYCIWTEDRTVDEINRTEAHEVCHKYVKDEAEHFCGGKK